jgi:hypothetical protein
MKKRIPDPDFGLVRFPRDLLSKLRVLSLTGTESMGDMLARMTRGDIESEFSKLPADVQKLARKGEKVEA